MLGRVLISVLLEMVLLIYVATAYKRKRKWVLKIICSYALLCFITGILGLFQINSVLKVVMTLGTIIFINYILFEMYDFWTYIKNGFFLMVYSGISEIFLVAIVWLISNSRNIDILNRAGAWYFAIICAKAIEFLMITALQHIKDREINKKRVQKNVILEGAIFALFLCYIISMSLAINLPIYNPRLMSTVLLIEAVIMFLLIVVYFWLLKAYEDNVAKEMELNLTRENVTFQMEFYREREKEDKELKEMYHDLGNLKLVLDASRKEGYDTSKVVEYVNKMDRYLGKKSEIFTGNSILDMFLKEKEKECLRNEIELICNVDFSRGDFINIIDAGTIFGNLINNAREGCEKIEGKQDRKINLSVFNYEGFIIIEISNPCISTIKVGGRFLTTKADEVNHGIGLEMIGKIVKKYGGEYDYRVKEDRFVVYINIPEQP